MRLTFRDSQFAIFDDVLPAESYALLWQHLQTLPFSHVHGRRIEGVWRPADGNPMAGQSLVVPGLDVAEFGGKDALKAKGYVTYPTGTPLDAPVQALEACLPEVAELVGQKGRDWFGIHTRPWIYPAGTRLSWHDDEAAYTGAFVFYLHPVWNVLWGGELLVANEAVRARATHAAEPVRQASVLQLDNEGENQELLQEGFGRFVFPKPNRLVFMASGVSHMIAAVSPAAGTNVRASLGGFFLRRPKTAEGFLDMLFGREQGQP